MTTQDEAIRVLTATAFEEIAESWDGCEYDLVGDIGAALRRDFTRLANIQPVAAQEAAAYIHSVDLGKPSAVVYSPVHFRSWPLGKQANIEPYMALYTAAPVQATPPEAHTATPPSQDATEAAELQTLLVREFYAYRPTHPAGLMAWARIALLDNSPHRMKSAATDTPPAVAEGVGTALPEPQYRDHGRWYDKDDMTTHGAQQREAGRRDAALDYGLLKLTLEQTQTRLAQADAAIESLATKPAEGLSGPEIIEIGRKFHSWGIGHLQDGDGEWTLPRLPNCIEDFARAAILAQQAKKGNTP